jgi:valyl-tRNA synthetase
VLDTWFSSQLWPFSTFGWPAASEDLSYFYPTSFMAPGYEILYLWVARMIVSGLYFMGDVPFRSVMIHGIVRDFEGKKMSKSKGNVIDPLSMIERYGADALRFSLAFTAVPGHDTNISEDRIEGARNFANKLWNASRFVLLSLGDERPSLDATTALDPLDLKDRWILSRLDATVEAIEEHLEAFNWSEALRSLHRFVWSEYCDWYIELAKLDLAGGHSARTRAVLLQVLDRILRLLHPIMPFITEELWSLLRPGEGSIMKASWPSPDGRRYSEAEPTMERFQELVTAVRRMKVEYGIPPAKRIPVTLSAGPHTQELEGLRDALSSLARLESVEFRSDVPSTGGRARVLTPSGIEASVVLEDVIDLDAERRRLSKRIEETDQDLERLERKLADREFVSKAPSAVVEKERARLEEARAARGKLEEQLRSLSL